MRKNFLILMLMALLPLAGFAAVLDETKFSATNINYGTSTFPTVSNTGSYTSGTDYTVDETKFYKDAAGAESIAASALSTTGTGTYYIQINGAGTYASQDPFYIPFLINGVAISDGDVTIATGTYTYNGSQQTPGVTVTVSSVTLTKDTDYTLEYGENINAGTGAGSATVKGIGNYSGNITKTFDIASKAFTTANVTVTVTNNEVTYDGTADQTATVVVADKTLGTLTAGTDYEVEYATGHKDVGSYAITVKGKGNYTTASITPTEQLVIGKATVLVTPSATKTYDGKKDLPTSFSYSYEGFVDATAPTVTTTGVACTSSDAKAAVGEYKLAVTAATAGNFSVSPDNYTFVPVEGKFTITKKNATIKANDQTVAYGGTIDEHDVALTDVLTSSPDDQTAVKAAVIVYQDGTALKVKANDAATDAQKAVLANYNPTYTDGVLTTTKATITIALNSNVKLTKAYDGTAAAITEDVTDEDNLTIIGSTIGTDALDLTGLTATVATNTGAVNTEPGYKVTLAGATVTNPENYNINYVTTYYKVTKKALTIAIPAQTKKVGETIETDLFTVDGLVGTDTQDALFDLVLTSDAYESATDNTKVKSGASSGKYIVINVKDATKAGNYSGYETTAIQGDLVVASADVILDTNNKITTTAATNKSVTFSTSRVLNPDHWNAMVLPFEVSVAKLSQAFGYAVVNRLNTTTSTADNIQFSLEMQKIPANEPFLIKIVGAEQTDGSYKAVALNGVTISGVDVVAATSKKIDASGNIFEGVYEEKELLGSTYGFIYDGTDRDNKWYTPRNNAYTLQPLDAFLTYATAKAPMITVEDIDGSVTAISEVKAGEFQAVKADGWYTLNGVRLQGAPTQKGIYINNGKKVVIK